MCQGGAEAAFCCKPCATMLGKPISAVPSSDRTAVSCHSRVVLRQPPRPPGGGKGEKPAHFDVVLKGSQECAISLIDDLPCIILGYLPCIIRGYGIQYLTVFGAYFGAYYGCIFYSSLTQNSHVSGVLIWEFLLSAIYGIQDAAFWSTLSVFNLWYNSARSKYVSR